MEVSIVRRRLLGAMNEARKAAQERRARNEEARTAYRDFLQRVAAPMARQVATALKAEGHHFVVSAPEGGLRLDSHGPDDFIELRLRTDADPPVVVGHVRHLRGSRTIDEERVLAPGTPIPELSEEQLLDLLVELLRPWLER